MQYCVLSPGRMYMRRYTEFTCIIAYTLQGARLGLLLIYCRSAIRHPHPMSSIVQGSMQHAIAHAPCALNLLRLYWPMRRACSKPKTLLLQGSARWAARLSRGVFPVVCACSGYE